MTKGHVPSGADRLRFIAGIGKEPASEPRGTLPDRDAHPLPEIMVRRNDPPELNGFPWIASFMTDKMKPLRLQGDDVGPEPIAKKIEISCFGGTEEEARAAAEKARDRLHGPTKPRHKGRPRKEHPDQMQGDQFIRALLVVYAYEKKRFQGATHDDAITHAENYIRQTLPGARISESAIRKILSRFYPSDQGYHPNHKRPVFRIREAGDNRLSVSFGARPDFPGRGGQK